jgi:hypothetical protein
VVSGLIGRFCPCKVTEKAAAGTLCKIRCDELLALEDVFSFRIADDVLPQPFREKSSGKSAEITSGSPEGRFPVWAGHRLAGKTFRFGQ